MNYEHANIREKQYPMICPCMKIIFLARGLLIDMGEIIKKSIKGEQ